MSELATALFGFVNLAFMGMGANIWGSGTLVVGLLVTAVIIPVFLYRHYITDGGEFPEQMYTDMQLAHGEEGEIKKRCGLLPYITLAAATLVVIFFNWIAVY